MKKQPASAGETGDVGSIPGLGGSAGEGHGNPLRHSCWGKSHRKRSLVGYSPWGRKELDMTEQAHIILHYWLYQRVSEFVEL